MVGDLALLYLDFCKSDYRKHGKTTREFEYIRSTRRQLIGQFGTSLILNFGPRKLRRLRDSLINKPDDRMKPGSSRVVSRSYINESMSKVVRMLKWAAARAVAPRGRRESPEPGHETDTQAGGGLFLPTPIFLRSPAPPCSRGASAVNDVTAEQSCECSSQPDERAASVRNRPAYAGFAPILKG